MAAPVTRCECGSMLDAEELQVGLCAACQEPEQDLLDDPDAYECCSCEDVTTIDDVDEDGVCSACREEQEHRRQLESDYRFWTR